MSALMSRHALQRPLAGFMRFEHNLTDLPVMWYAGLGHTEAFS